MKTKSQKQALLETSRKLDLRKQFAAFYNPPANLVEIVEVPRMNFLMVDGKGDPNTAPAYKESIEILYGVSYTLKFGVKKEKHLDYSVMPLEGIWYGDMSSPVQLRDWSWTSMIMQPEIATGDMVERAVDELEQRKKIPGLGKIRFEHFEEGTAAQIMHIGPYATENPTIERLHRHIMEKGLKMRGYHHEIYLGDPRRSAPSRLRTILRQPVSKPE